MAVLPMIRLWAFTMFEGSRITGRQRGDVGYQFWFIEDAAFFVGKDAVVSEVFFPRRLISGNDGIVKFLSATHQFVLCNRNIRGAGEGYCGEKCNEREFHETR